MEKNVDVLGRYKSITNKLKKRFLKKPNVSEGSEQFASLAKVLSNQECPQYAGFCYLAQARCEHSLGNASGEAQALLEAARAFLHAEEDLRVLNCITFNEHLAAALNSYGHAIRVHLENKEFALAAGLSGELGSSLQRLGKYSEAIPNFERAAMFQEKNTLQRLFFLTSVATCKVDMRDYVGALDTYTDMQIIAEENGHCEGQLMSAYYDIISRCEITRVLLLMLLKPTPQRIKPEHAKTLEKYTWETAETAGAGTMSEDLFLLLQSVVMACQSKDLEALIHLERELIPMLSNEQNQLLHLVISELQNPSGEGL